VKLKREIELLHQKLKDQNEISTVKITRLEEKLKNFETNDHSENQKSHIQSKFFTLKYKTFIFQNFS